MTQESTQVSVIWRGRRVQAFVPRLIAGDRGQLTERTIRATAAAAAHVTASAAAMPVDYAPLARLLLRAEGLASSFIEGITAPVVDIVLAEEQPAPGDSPASWVAANLAAVTEAVTAAHEPLTSELLCHWHATLMTGSPTPARLVGRVREEQGWIGGTSPLDAALVTPPADRLPGLLTDLCRYTRRDDVDPVTQAAVAHAQFELIHPFGDGNGRVGRVLVAHLLTRRLSLVTPPPVSTAIAADVGGYSAGLARFRLGDVDGWVRWFAGAISGAGEAQQELVREVDRLVSDWRRRVVELDRGRAVRSDAAVWQVLDLLPLHLTLTAATIQAETGLSDVAASRALGLLVAAGVLTEHGVLASGARGRPPRLYVSEELLGLTGASPLR